MPSKATAKAKDFTLDVAIGATPHEVFEAVLDPRAWWSRGIEGKSRKVGDEFTFEVKGIHFSRQRLVEVVPDHRVVWEVTDSNLQFVDDPSEWTGTRIEFEISPGAKTRLRFTHHGLKPHVACYDMCTPAWTNYIQGSLASLAETGTGTPNLEG